MKKTITTLFSLACVVGAVNAEVIDFTTNASSDSPGFPTESADFNVYYAGATGKEARLGGTNENTYVYNPLSLTMKAGDGTSTYLPDKWNLLGTFNFDIASTEAGEKVVIKNETAKTFQIQLGKINIKNSSETSEATAVIDMGSSYLYVKGNTSDQTPELNISTNTKITGTKKDFILSIDTNGTLYVSNNSQLTIDGNARVSNTATQGTLKGLSATVTIDAGSTIDIAKGKTLSFETNAVLTNNGTISGKGAILKISSGQNITMDGVVNLTQYKDDAGKITRSSVYIDNGTKITANNKFFADNITIDGTESSLVANDLDRTNGATTLSNGATIIVNGKMVTGQGQSLNISSASKMIVNSVNKTGDKSLNNYKITDANSLLHIKTSVTTNRSGSVFDDGVLQIDGTYTIANNGNRTVFTQAAATVVTVGKSNEYAGGGGKIKADAIILSTAKLDLQTVNAITNASGNAINLTTDVASKRSLLVMSASQTFDTITADKANLELEITGDAVLTASFVSSNGGKIFINGFAENRIFVANADQIQDTNSVFFAYATKDDASTQISQLYLNNGWLSAIAPTVPEPAEWAMIFGAIALCLAVYRKRK